MRLTRIQIESISKFSAIDQALPAVCIVTGKNGAGKSSFLDAIRYAFARGHDEDILKGGSEKGQVCLTFDDGGVLKCNVSRSTPKAPGETTRMYRKPGSKRFEVGRADIDKIANAISYDPVSFLNLPERGTATKPGQLETMLQVVPIAVTKEEILKAVDGATDDIVLPPGLNGFDAIGVIHKQLYDSRTALNTEAKRLHVHSEELVKPLPPETETGQEWVTEANRLTSDKEAKEQHLAVLVDGIRKVFNGEKDRLVEEKNAKLLEIDGEYSDQIMALQQKRDKDKGAVIELAAEQIEAARKVANNTASKIQDDHAPAIEDLTARIAVAHERSRSSAAAASTRAAAKLAREQAEQSKATADKMTKALDNLNSLRKSLASRIEIPGIEISDGRICREENGSLVPLKRWNAQSRMTFCLRLARLAHGEAGFILMDSCEQFDQENREALLEAASHYAETEGLQFIMAFVGEDDEVSVVEA